MSGFISDNNLESNNIEKAKQDRIRRGLSLIDLSCSNPVKHGLLFPEKTLQAAASAYFNSRQYNPDAKGLRSAREVIAEYYRRRCPEMSISPDNIFLTASTSESYNLLFTLLGESGDNIIGPSVMYPLFDLFAEARGLILRSYEMKESQNWDIDEKSFDAALDLRSRAILVVSPHNPTGMVLEKRVEAFQKSALPLICDEVFAEFSSTGRTAPLLMQHYQEQPVFILNGISKMFALPDLKLGWILLNDHAMREYGERLEILNDCFLSCASPPQAMLESIFHAGLDFMHLMTQRVRNNIIMACEILSANPLIDIKMPQGGAFVFPRIKAEIDEEDLVLALINKGVFTYPGYFFGADNVHLFISCILEENTLRQGLSLLNDTISRL